MQPMHRPDSEMGRRLKRSELAIRLESSYNMEFRVVFVGHQFWPCQKLATNVLHHRTIRFGPDTVIVHDDDEGVDESSALAAKRRRFRRPSGDPALLLRFRPTPLERSGGVGGRRGWRLSRRGGRRYAHRDHHAPDGRVQPEHALPMLHDRCVVLAEQLPVVVQHHAVHLLLEPFYIARVGAARGAGWKKLWAFRQLITKEVGSCRVSGGSAA